MDYESARGHESEGEAEAQGLVSEIAAAAAAATWSGGIPLLPNAENVVVLPEGASLDDIEVRGSDLVVELPDGRVYIIPDGAIFVPVIVIDGVAVPPLNLAAYLIGEQPQPAAGTTQSSGGNFADPADPIQPAFGLGDLLPYTELGFPLAQEEEVLFGLVNNEPAITFVPQTGDGTEVREAHLPPSTSSRTNESPGTQFDGDAETTSGTITFTSLDGVGSVTINGVTINPAGLPQVVASDPTGTLVVTGFTFDPDTGNGSISYSYTLNDNTAATDGSEVSFPITVTDSDGDTATDTLVIGILDDAPSAVADTATVVEGGVLTGNVLPNDVFGADGRATAGGVIGVRAAGGDTATAVTTGAGTQIQGQYGTLTLNANGSYTYDGNPNVTGQDVTDVFVYTIEDGDGDRSTTTLTITIDDVTGTLSDNDAAVDESGLDGIGSQIVPNGEFFTGGQISVAGATGPFTYTLTSPANGTYGTLTLNGSTGAYSYVLDTPFDGPTSNNGRNTINDGESFGYQVTDQNGNVIGTGTIDIDIVDDIPTATEDFDTVEEGGSTSGNVLPNDIFGADGAAATSPAGGVIGVRPADGDETTEVTTGTGTQIRGEHGVLTLNANGSYTYDADANIPDSGVIDVFVYTIEDGDGDRSTTTLTITIEDATGVVTDSDAIVDESGLDVIGSQIVPDGEFFTGGQITVVGAGPFTYTLTSPANGTYGTLTLNGSTGAYSYVLDTPFDGPTSNNGRNTINDGESFGYQVTDQNGNVIGTGTIDIDIVDDIPTATEDFDTVEEGGSTSGNVLPNDIFGADGAAATSPAGGVIGVRPADGDETTEVTTGTGTQIRGEHGVLTLNANGSYTYDADANIPDSGVIDVFVYTIEDGDGDRSTTTLTITIEDVTGVVTDSDAIVDESGLDVIGSQIVPNGEFYNGQINVSGATGPFTYTLLSPANGTYGTLTLNSTTGAYTYELDTPFDEPTDNNGRDTINDADSFAYQVTDQNGNIIGTGTIFVDIVDDVPQAFADFNTVDEGGTVNGNVLTDGSNDIFGADGPASTSPAGGVIGVRAANGDTTTEVTGGTGTQIQGDFGTLTLNADGSYTYEADPNVTNQDVVDVFVYTIEDGDGDRSTTTLTIAIDNIAGSVSDSNALVDESGLDGIGSQIEPNGEFFSGQILVSDASGTFTYTLLSPPDGAYGTLTLNTGTGEYTYELDTPFDGPTNNNGRNPINGAESFAYEVRDQANVLIGTGTINVTIVDDVPSAADDGTYVVAEDGTPIDIVDALDNDVFGADGVNLATGVAVTTNASKGTAVYNGDGTFTYTPNVGAEGADSFTYTITDGDGDTATATVTVNIDVDSVPEGGATTAAVDDDGLTGPPAGNPASTVGDLDSNLGSDGVAGGQPDDADGGASSEASFSGTLDFAYGGDGAGSVGFAASMDGKAVTVGEESVTYSVVGNVLTAKVSAGEDRAGTSLFTVTLTDTTTGTYTVQLLDNVLHTGGPNNEAVDATAAIDFTVLDSDTSSATTSLTITFDDDAPTASDETASADEGETITGTLDFVEGADGASVTKIDGETLEFGDDGYSQVIDIGPGEIKVKADGSYSFTADANGSGTASATFTVTDGDNDTATADIDITIEDANTPTGGATTAAVDDDGLTGGNAASTVGDLDSNLGSDGVAGGQPDDADGGASSEASFSGTLNFAYGGDGAGSVGFAAAMNGATTTVGEESVTYSVAGNVLTAKVSAGEDRAGTSLFTVTLTDTTTGTYTVQLLDNVLHTGGPNNEAVDATAAIDFTVLDSDTSSATASLTVTFDDDAPTASDEVTNANEGATITGVLDFVPGADGASVTKINAVTLVFDAKDSNYSQAIDIGPGSIKVKADGSYSFTADANGTGTTAATFTVTDGDNDTATADIEITILDVNEPPVTLDSHTWMSSDPAQQTAATPTFADGYPVGIEIPTDADGDNLVVTATNSPTGVFYFNGTTYVAVTAATVLYDPNSGINYLDNIVYRPTTTIDDTPVVTLSLSVSDGTVSVGQTVTIHEVAPEAVPGPTGAISSDKSPLTSGNDADATVVLTDDFANALDLDPSAGTVTFRTNFQSWNDHGDPHPTGGYATVNAGDQNGDELEAEVNVYIYVDGIQFQAIVVNDGNPDDWTYNAASGLMETIADFDDVFNVSNPTQSLAEYLDVAANTPTAGDSWTVEYDDTTPGNDQARYFDFAFEVFDPGDPGIIVDGHATLPDTIYGTSGDDILSGNGGIDTILGRGGTDDIDLGPQPPVVLDLDGDGVEFVPLAGGVAFDYDGDGTGDASAWVGADDGLLAQDLNGDGLVTEAAEFVFGNAALTDLQALAARFDDTLDADDADFASFGVWRDGNGDGVSQEGEFRSLNDLGITSISLISDAKGYSAANGDVTVHGQATYARADGSKGTLADVSFAVGTERVLVRSLEIATTTAAAGMLASAAVAETPPAQDIGAIAAPESPSEEQQSSGTRLYLPADDSDAGSFGDDADSGAAAAEPVAVESHSGDEADDTSSADLAQLIDHYSASADSADQPSSADASGSESLIAAADAGTMEVMQGLLLLAEAPPPEAASVDGDGGADELGAVHEALADAAAENFVDALIAQLGAGEVSSASEAPQQDLAGLLTTDVGSEPGLGTNGFDFNQMVEEAQALAAA